MEQGVGKIKTHDGHPAKHGDGGKVAKVPNACTEKFIKESTAIVNGDQKNSDKCDADNIVENYPSMECLEIWDIPIDNENDEQGKKTDHSSGSVDIQHIAMCQPIRVCGVGEALLHA